MARWQGRAYHFGLALSECVTIRIVCLEAEAMKKLDDSQVESFDTDYVTGARWETVKARVDRDFPGGDFRFLDLGGGNGVFTDCLLEAYPKAQGTVLDNSELLL